MALIVIQNSKNGHLSTNYKLRRKNKESMRPSFIINNKRIIELRIIADELNKYSQTSVIRTSVIRGPL